MCRTVLDAGCLSTAALPPSEASMCKSAALAKQQHKCARKCDFLAEIRFDLSPSSDDGEESARGERFWVGMGVWLWFLCRDAAASQHLSIAQGMLHRFQKMISPIQLHSPALQLSPIITDKLCWFCLYFCRKITSIYTPKCPQSFRSSSLRGTSYTSQVGEGILNTKACRVFTNTCSSLAC